MCQLLKYWVQLEERTLTCLQVLQGASFPTLYDLQQIGKMMIIFVARLMILCVLLDDTSCHLSKKKISKIKKKIESVQLESFEEVIDQMTSVG